MLNESRIKLMTKMASFEAGEGKKSMAIGTYFKGNYIWKEVIKSIIYGTLAFFIVVGLLVAYDLESLLSDIYKMDLLDVGKTIAFNYLKFILAYGIITYIVFSLRYTKARHNLRAYYNNLRRLSSMYKKEDREKRERTRARRNGRPQ